MTEADMAFYLKNTEEESTLTIFFQNQGNLTFKNVTENWFQI